VALAQPALAQSYPQRQVTVVVPIGAGGGVDATGRLFAEKLAERLKQPVVVENKVGAGGMVGTDYVAKSAPDGHTILVMETSAVLHKWLHNEVPFDVVSDFTPIARVAISPLILIANPSFAPNSVREVIALAERQPGKLSAGTPGIGTPHHLALLMLNALAKVDIVNVPYRGAAAALNDLLAGQIPMSWAAPTAAMPHVAAGKLKALGVTSLGRSATLPELPTLVEQGYPDFEAISWQAVLAPAGTPAPIVARLNEELRKAVASDDVKKRIHADGGDALVSTPEEYTADIDQEEKKWSALIRKLGLRVD
jgi:tripartite-type tricarboxylate transporter receptor subunit TctC